MSNFDRKIILITGASQGMGRATALYLAEKGVLALTLFARGREALEEVKKEVEAMNKGTKVLIVTGDAASAADNQKAVDETVAAFGGITGAFVNAGIFRGGKPVHETGDDDIDAVFNVNMKGVIYAFRALIPAIKTTLGDSNKNAGSIVVNSSCMGQAIISPKSAGSSIYSASKAFLNSLVETAAIENAPRIRVNTVMPGVIQTSIMPVDDDTYQKIGAALQPLYGRAGKPVEVAAMVSFLLGDEASFISGSHMKIDGLWGLSDGGFSFNG